MKKIYLLFLLNVAFQFAKSQPAVSFAPQIGDVVTTEYALTTGISQGAGGANMTWDYSNLMDSATAGTIYFKSAAGTPYVADFPGAQFTAELGDTLFSYYETVSGTPAILGVESPSAEFVYAHPLATLVNPFTYPDSFIDSVTLFLEKPFTGNSKLLDTTMVTGYGTLKLPGSTYNNVLQVREISASSGSVTIPGVGVIPVPPTLDTTYAYYVNGQPSPLLFYNVKNGAINLIYYLKSSVLPLHFISFTAVPGHGNVQLNWQTGDESNTDVFHIQRSTDGSDFSNIGEVNASGNGSHNYDFTDVAPPLSQTLYYRLQETDIDGKSTYSNIIECNMPGNVAISLYPNPANSLITIMGIGNYTSLKIYDLSGQQLAYYNLNGESITVPLTSMVAGVYIAELSDGSKTTRVQFLKK